MFHNVLMTTLTPLRNTDEIKNWQNHPFTTHWPEDQRPPCPPYQPRNTEVVKKIKKQKRHRTAYSTNQLCVLEQTFLRTKYIHSETRKKLSETLNISERSIKVWFQNRRMKEKKESSESGSETSTDVLSDVYPPRYSPISPVLSESSVEVPKQELASQEVTCQEVTNLGYSVVGTEATPYQLPSYHFCHRADGDNISSTTNPPSEVFANDPSTYPTYYYPTMGDYYYPQNYLYDLDQGNMQGYNTMQSNDVEWAATNFDLNYFH